LFGFVSSSNRMPGILRFRCDRVSVSALAFDSRRLCRRRDHASLQRDAGVRFLDAQLALNDRMRYSPPSVSVDCNTSARKPQNSSFAHALRPTGRTKCRHLQIRAKPSIENQGNYEVIPSREPPEAASALVCRGEVNRHSSPYLVWSCGSKSSCGPRR
jgi:hypothetical protein